MDLRTAVAVAVLVLVVVMSYLLIWRSWRRRVEGDTDLPPLPTPVESTPVTTADIVYHGTTIGGDWLERIGAHGLGRRAGATLAVSPDGVTISPLGAPPWSIPRSGLRGARADRAAAGRAVRRAEYLIITWEHGEHLLDTAVRPRRRGDLATLVEAVARLAGGESGAEGTEPGKEKIT